MMADSAKALRDGKLRGKRSFGGGSLLIYGFGMLILTGILIFGALTPSLRAADCAELGGSIQSEHFSPSAYGLKGTPGNVYSCVDDAGKELKNYGLSGL